MEAFIRESEARISRLEKGIKPANSAFATRLRKDRLAAALLRLQQRPRPRKAHISHIAHTAK
jgi:hypothetical protein